MEKDAPKNTAKDTPKDTPLSIEKLNAAQEREFRITAPRQIQSILQHVLEGWPRAALYFGGGEEDFIMISLLEIDDGEGLWVSQTMDVEKNHGAMASNHITVVCLLDQVKIQFSVGEVSPVLYEGFPAFYLSLPESLYRIQRREYYRLATPISEAPRCVITLNEPHEGEKVAATIMDISVGGMRLSCPEGELELEQDQVYSGCEISLPGVGKIVVAMKVKSMFVIESHGITAKYAGCEFENLSNAASSHLQRYVTIQQHLKAGA